MSEFPWGTIIIFSLFCVAAIMAFAEGLQRQRNMQQSIKEIHDSVQEVREAVKSVSAKAKERISNIEGRLEACQSCPTQDRRTAERRKSNDDWMNDSNFKMPDRKPQ
jgi:small-conductance mechanosensitive channel